MWVYVRICHHGWTSNFSRYFLFREKGCKWVKMTLPINSVYFKNIDLYNKLLDAGISVISRSKVGTECIVNFIMRKISEAGIQISNDFFQYELTAKVNAFCNHLATKWKSKGVRRIRTKFLANCSQWLDLRFEIPVIDGKYRYDYIYGCIICILQ